MQHRLLIGVLITASMVCGCTTEIRRPPEPSTLATGAIIGGVGGAAIGSAVGTTAVGAIFGVVVGSVLADFIEKNRTEINEVQDAGIQVSQVGDEVTLVLPTDLFFVDKSPAFNTSSYPTLDKVVKVLNRYPNISIKVTGYTDNVDSSQRNYALSNQRAQNIAKYLWSHGVDTRLLYAVGKGECNPIARNDSSSGRAANRRVEITLREVR